MVKISGFHPGGGRSNSGTGVIGVEIFLSAVFFSIVWRFGLATKVYNHLTVFPKFNSGKCLDSFSGLLSLLTSGHIYNWLHVLIIVK